MDEIHEPKEIVSSRSGSAAAQPRTVVSWDARQAGQIGRDAMRALTLLHESFARNLNRMRWAPTCGWCLRRHWYPPSILPIETICGVFQK